MDIFNLLKSSEVIEEWSDEDKRPPPIDLKDLYRIRFTIL